MGRGRGSGKGQGAFSISQRAGLTVERSLFQQLVVADGERVLFRAHLGPRFNDSDPVLPGSATGPFLNADDGDYVLLLHVDDCFNDAAAVGAVIDEIKGEIACFGRPLYVLDTANALKDALTAAGLRR